MSTHGADRPSQEFLAALQNNDQFVIISHEHPDPDSLGSMLGLFHGLRKLGKKCQMISNDPIPSNLSWPGVQDIQIFDDHTALHDGPLIVLDCDPARTGRVAVLADSSKTVFNIDHHQGNSGGGVYNYIDPSEAATAVMIYRLLKELAVPFDPSIAQALYGGIVGDTGGFRYANTSADVLQIAAELVGLGANPAQTSREVFECKSWSFMKLLGFALNNLAQTIDGKIVWMKISHDDFLRFRADPTQTDQLVQYARMVETAEIAILFREVSPGEIRVGFRSNDLDVGSLARSLGGGGHKLASGAKIEGPLLEVVENVLAEAKRQLFGRQ